MWIHELNTKALTDPAYVAFDDGEDTYKTEFNDCVENAANAAVAAADLTENEVAFTSGDAASPTAWTNVSVITTGSTLATLFNRISTMVKNVRYLWNLIGSSSFSNVASTLSGAIGNTALTTTAQTLSGAIAEHESAISTLNGNTELSITAATNVTISSASHVYLCGGKYLYLAVKGYTTAAVSNADLFSFSGNKNIIVSGTVPIGIGGEWTISSVGYGFIGAKKLVGTVPSGTWFHVNMMVPTA